MQQEQNNHYLYLVLTFGKLFQIKIVSSPLNISLELEATMRDV